MPTKKQPTSDLIEPRRRSQSAARWPVKSGREDPAPFRAHVSAAPLKVRNLTLHTPQAGNPSALT